MVASNGALVDSTLPVMGAAPVFTLNPLGPIGVVIADMAVNVQVGTLTVSAEQLNEMCMQ